MTALEFDTTRERDEAIRWADRFGLAWTLATDTAQNIWDPADTYTVWRLTIDNKGWRLTIDNKGDSQCLRSISTTSTSSSGRQALPLGPSGG